MQQSPRSARAMAPEIAKGTIHKERESEVATATAAHEPSAGVTRRLAQHASSLRYEQFPAPLVERIKQCLLDTLGVSIGASTLAEEASIVVDYVRALGGAPESSILGFGGKAPAAWAAFANGSLGHMLDYDDVGGGAGVPWWKPILAAGNE